MEQSFNQNENGVCCDSTQSSPRHSLLSKCHMPYSACKHTRMCTHTHTHARANYFIYAYTESKAFPESSFTRLINAQQCYVHISYQISPKSDNKCAKYGYKLIYTAK